MTYDDVATKYNLQPYCGGGVGDGWAPLLDRLCEKLQALGYDFTRVAQIKEKFGGLRFYADNTTKEMEAAIDAAEDESYRTCEECGEPGRVRTSGWHRTLCDVHAKEHGK